MNKSIDGLPYKLNSDDTRNNKSSYAWDILFEKYDIAVKVSKYGFYDINTDEMMRNSDIIELWQQRYENKTIPDNRNVLKFDFSADLPNVFKGYNLQIMPIGSKTCRIAPFNMYHQLENEEVPIVPITSPIKIASLDFNNITTEPNAQTVAEITGMFKYIFNDLDPRNKTAVSTLSGKNNVHDISFSVDSSIKVAGKKGNPVRFDIDSWQAEIDGVYESDESILIVESKMKFPKDFNIRQLFIPRLLVERIMVQLKMKKQVFAGYFVKTKDVYIFTIYIFEDLNNMNSIKLYKQYKFRLSEEWENVYRVNQKVSDDTKRDNCETAEQIIEKTRIRVDYPFYKNGNEVSFPQANNLQVAMDYLDLLNETGEYHTESGELVERSSAEAFTDTFKYNRRQYNYYLNWLGYFGLVDREGERGKPTVTKVGMLFRTADFDHRNKQLLKLMAVHQSSRTVLLEIIRDGKTSDIKIKEAIKNEMAGASAKTQIGEKTLERRISGIKSMCKQLLIQMPDALFKK